MRGFLVRVQVRVRVMENQGLEVRVGIGFGVQIMSTVDRGIPAAMWLVPAVPIAFAQSLSTVRDWLSGNAAPKDAAPCTPRLFWEMSIMQRTGFTSNADASAAAPLIPILFLWGKSGVKGRVS